MQNPLKQTGPPRHSASDNNGRIYSRILGGVDNAKTNPKVFAIVFAVFGLFTLIVVYAASAN